MYFREDCLSPERSEVEFRSDGKKPGAGGRAQATPPPAGSEEVDSQ
jgi:hypothetical protein